MPQFTAFETWYGRNMAPPRIIKLAAGGLHAEFENGDLRYLRTDKHELIRRIYVAVRDSNWNTIPGHISNLDIQMGDDRFRIRYDSIHLTETLAYRWHAEYTGYPDGSIEVSMDGVAESDFLYNRIGFCVLHPIAGIAGRSYQALTEEGWVSGTLPEIIGPQQIVNGFEAPIFPSCSELNIDLDQGIRINHVFEGDLFEMEDQRNWTDGSFKTYCTPLSLGYPHQVRAGQPFHQKIIIRAEVPGQLAWRSEAASTDDIALHLAGGTGQHLPSIGFGLPEDSARLSPREVDLLSQLRPDHLKAVLHLGALGWEAELERAFDTVGALHSTLELALFLGDHPEESLPQLAARLSGKPVARIIVFHETEAANGTTSADWMNLVRTHLEVAFLRIPLIGGTNGNFAELNRQPPDTTVMDGVSYTINPQVHAFDERSLIEGIEAERDTVVAARSFCGELPITVSSVTLKPPFNQAAIEPGADWDPHELPSSVDPRQMSLFAAAWTVGSLASLGIGGADSITYYETTGWRGLIETEAGNPLPEKFPSYSAMVYPVYWIFAFLSEAKQAEFLRIESAYPLLVGGLGLNKGNRRWILVSNYQPFDQMVHLSSLPKGSGVLRRLNQVSMKKAAAAPETYRAQGKSLDLKDSTLEIILRPYETICVDYQVQV